MLSILENNEFCKKCGRCCINTEMILTVEDIQRLASLGYRVEDYAEYRDGYLRLRNIDGHCIFYDPASGLCRVYKYRPIGCRLYPIVFYVDFEGVTVDEYCPQSHLITKEDLRKALKLRDRISRGLIKA